MRDQVEDVFLKVGARAGDDVHLVLADHLGKRDAQFRSAQWDGECDHHLATVRQVSTVTVAGINQCSGVEVTEVVTQERAYWSSGNVGHWRHDSPQADRSLAAD